MMIRYKATSNQGACIIDGGKAYLFNTIGNFLNEEVNLTPKLLDGLLNLPIISILSSGGQTDVMIHNSDDTDYFYTTNLSSSDCAGILTLNRDFIKILRRLGKYENITFNQIIFVYNQTTNLNSKLPLLKLTKRD